MPVKVEIINGLVSIYHEETQKQLVITPEDAALLASSLKESLEPYAYGILRDLGVM